MTSTVFDLVGKHAVEKGLPWSLSFTRRAGASRTPVDLSGCSARLEIFDALNGDLLATLSSATGEVVLGGMAGTCAINMAGAISAAWSVKTLRYRLFFTDSLGADRLFLRGRLGLLAGDV